MSRIITIGVTIATAANIGVVVALNIVAAATMVKPFMHIMFLDPIQSNLMQCKPTWPSVVADVVADVVAVASLLLHYTTVSILFALIKTYGTIVELNTGTPTDRTKNENRQNLVSFQPIKPKLDRVLIKITV